jgi:hypothetical protein
VLKLGFVAVAVAIIGVVVVAEPQPTSKREVLTVDALADAQEAFVKGKYVEAIALARPRIASEPLKAWRIIGASNCSLKNAPGATEAYKALDAEGRRFVEYVCKRNDITLPGASKLRHEPARSSAVPRS